MRLLVCSICTILFLACTPQKVLQKPFFLIGDWKRLNNKEGKTTYEFWKSDFSGLGITLQKKDTLYLKVEGVNAQPTLFKFTQQSDTSFVAENPKNEFPKKIKYWASNQKLYAKIWNDESFAVEFIFKRIPPGH